MQTCNYKIEIEGFGECGGTATSVENVANAWINQLRKIGHTIRAVTLTNLDMPEEPIATSEEPAE